MGSQPLSSYNCESLLAEEGWEGFLKEEGGKVSPAGYCEVTEELPTLQIQDGPQGSQRPDPTAFLTFCHGSRKGCGGQPGRNNFCVGLRRDFPQRAC